MGPPAAIPVGAKVLSALRWSAATRLVGQVVSWTMTVFVIRLLSPSDYGVLAMAVILPSALYLLNDLGLDVVLVRRLAPGEEFRRQVFGVVIAVNLLCALILVTAAPLVAAFFSEPTLIPILRVLSLQFLLLVFETLPRARLEQGLDFRSQSLISLGANWLGGLTTLALALTGWGVWALVWGRLVSTATTTLALNVARALVRRHRDARARRLAALHRRRQGDRGPPLVRRHPRPLLGGPGPRVDADAPDR